MKKLLNLPHAKHESTCYVNGLYDFLTWNGGKYEYFLLPVIGGMAGFAYVKFKKANPPCMVYWGNRTKDLLNTLCDIIGVKQEISEGRSWETISRKIRDCINSGKPVLAGALDMYHLHYFEEVYGKIHIPIHHVLIVGYDDEKEVFHIRDCCFDEVQEVGRDDLKKALDVTVPGFSKRNTIRVFELTGRLPGECELAEKGFRMKAERMLRPPVGVLGIPAMRKLSKDITAWDNQECFNHMVAYAGMSPPLVPERMEDCNGLRFEQAGLLQRLGRRYKRDNWVEAGELFMHSGSVIIKLCDSALKGDGKKCAEFLAKIADTEERAYQMLV
ncbi:MAG: BtrH N-terminal domain-containing protein [Bacillota bacterium]